MSRGGTLCLHTPRADCNQGLVSLYERGVFASTRPVQIATTDGDAQAPPRKLCLHTPRADCNRPSSGCAAHPAPLPPHAPCRLQRHAHCFSPFGFFFASTRPVQIATQEYRRRHYHKPFASTRPVQIATLTICPVCNAVIFASTRPVQIATCSGTIYPHCHAPFASTRPVQIATRTLN